MSVSAPTGAPFGLFPAQAAVLGAAYGINIGLRQLGVAVRPFYGYCR